jgi:hypothetical protein
MHEPESHDTAQQHDTTGMTKEDISSVAFDGTYEHELLHDDTTAV